jgi:hypothetical protein
MRTPNRQFPAVRPVQRVRNVCWLAVLLAGGDAIRAQPPAALPTLAAISPVPALVSQYCADCHDSEMKKGGLDLDSIRLEEVTKHAEVWEKVVRKLAARQMPPMGKPRPKESTYEKVVSLLADSLDRAALEHPNPGRTETFRRLNRTEYQNAIRDLLALDVDATELLPKDDVSHGFDNVAVGDTFRIPADVTQEERVEGLPVGTRGGALIPYTFPRDGEYEIQIRLARDRNEEIEGLREPHELEVLLDRQRVKLFAVEPPQGHKNYDIVDAHLKFRFLVAAGLHQLGVTFLKNPSAVLETRRQPYQAHFNMHRHPRIGPAIYQVSINGPYESTGPGDTPSRRRVFVSRPTKPEEEEACAKQILSTLMRRAYRRPVTEEDLQKPMEFYRNARTEEGFEAGIQSALSAVLVSPQFLFRVEADPAGVPPRTPYRLSDLELASRLSFFLWSSIPDDELLEAATRGELHKPKVLEKQVRRMLADERSRNLASNFAGQWLYLRNLESVTPDLRLFPDFDDNLRQAFRRETEMLFESIVREDRNVIDLLNADYTFVNERLARHYGMPNIYGSHFRRVTLDTDSPRRGLLGQGSILLVTSLATRTSPVLRGKWILENILGTPPPEPPPNVPALKENAKPTDKSPDAIEFLSVRQRMEQHRTNATCVNCHKMMDPIGFALENFDAIGQWRTLDGRIPIDASGELVDGTKVAGPGNLRRALLRYSDQYVRTVTEKLLTYALGRGVEHYDMPVIRSIVREAARNNYRFSSLVLGIVKSPPFQMKVQLSDSVARQ